MIESWAMKLLVVSNTILAANRSSRKSNSSRDKSKHILRCRSSNVWGYAFDINDYEDLGTMIIQFKNASGGPGDIYEYFDVPVAVYQKMIGTPSKGHYFWKQIRDKYKYRKLTGDKRGKLKNAVNT